MVGGKESPRRPKLTGFVSNTTSLMANQHAVALYVATHSFAMGVAIGWNSVASFVMQVKNFPNDYISGPATVSLCLGTCIGALLLPAFVHFIGRPAPSSVLRFFMPTLFIALGWLLTYFVDFEKQPVVLLVLGRLLSGMGVGGLYVLIALYLSEIASTKARDVLLFYQQAALSLGVAASYCFAHLIYQHQSTDLTFYTIYCALTCLPALGLSCFLPPSPYSLREPKSILMKLHGRKDEEYLNFECQRIERDVEKIMLPMAKCTALREWSYWRTVMLTLILEICRQLSGIQLLTANFISFAEFSSIASPYERRFTATEMSLHSCLSQAALALLATAMVRWTGRRIMLLLSTCLMSLFALLLGFHFHDIMRENVQRVVVFESEWHLYVHSASFFGLYGLGFGAACWTIMFDSFPLQLRVITPSVIVGIGWLSCSVFLCFIINIINLFGIDTVIWLFSAICGLALFIGLFIPNPKREKENNSGDINSINRSENQLSDNSRIRQIFQSQLENY
ncbi:hypothetical protein TKK_0007266 [Trichogramma kaykai]|uniref:Major facilitator superfamily (MFS) profile domain-containing protein n=1 Tax=Trichogramma kaykai TaxID=54128 RepID=A0ABD2XAC9_9HYME